MKRGTGPRPPVQRTTLDWNVVQFPSASFRAKGGGGTRESVPSVMAACQSNSGSHTIARADGRTWGHKRIATALLAPTLQPRELPRAFCMEVDASLVKHSENIVWAGR